jgi:PAS domain S-box-containing protein
MDITEIRRAEAILREREKRYRQLYENNPLGYQSLNEGGKILEINAAWLDLLGYDREEVLGRPFIDIVTPDYKRVVKENFPKLLKRGEIQVPELVLEKKDGGTVHVALFGRASVDEDMGMLRTHCLIQDITDRKRMEAAVQKSAQLAAVGSVASGIAHEINNPLATISASTEALLARIPVIRKGRKKGSEALKTIDLFEDYLTMMLGEVERSGKIMRDLLDFARTRDFTLKPVDVVELIESTVRMLAIQSRFEHYAFVVDVEQKINEIAGDRDRLRQVLVILLTNAVESMPTGGRVWIRCDLDPMEDQLTLSVTDYGTGIEEDKIERIFEPFYTTKGAGGGTGLGLSIADTIVTKHGGRIEAHRNEDEGMTFTIFLPADPLEVDPESGGGDVGTA